MIRSALRHLVLLAAAVLVVAAPGARSATLDAIEYYNATLDHYFVTALADEIAKLDAGMVDGWQRTGQHFAVFDPLTPVAGASAVCRFYGLPAAGLDSHFYSASAAECAAVLRRFPGVWSEETDDAFGIWLPDTTTGQCPAGSVPVYRAWNHRVDSNHRFTTDPATQRAMIARGYIAEGYGPASMPVAMCAPGAGSPGGGAVPVCTLAASDRAPFVGQTIALTATCTNSPTAFAWTGCESSSSTCAATSASVGLFFYSVVASNAAGAGAAASTSVFWESLPPPPTCTLERTSQTDPPVVGSLLVLRAVCDSNPASFAWTGCSSTTNVCLVRERSAGSHGYAVVAANAGGTGAPASMGLSWSSTTPPAPGFCSQFPSYLLSDVGSEGSRVETASYTDSPGFAWNGVWTVRFVVPSDAQPLQLARLTAAQVNVAPAFREATISTTACDFRPTDPSGATGPVSRATGVTATNFFTVDGSRPGYPALQRGGAYYYNVRNWDPTSNVFTCPASAARCDAFVDVIIQR